MLNLIKNNEKIRFVISGLISTAVNFLFLLLAVEVIKISLVSVSNIFASFFGLSSSFFLNRYYVFKKFNKNIFTSYIHFIATNIITITFTSFLFLLWSDYFELDYRFGFILIYLFIAIINFSLFKSIIFK